MQQFHVRFHSSRDVQDFIAWATLQPYTLTVGNDHYHVNGSSFMGMFTLDHSRPLRVRVSCPENEFDRLLQEADRFLQK